MVVVYNGLKWIRMVDGSANLVVRRYCIHRFIEKVLYAVWHSFPAMLVEEVTRMKIRFFQT